MQKLILKSIDYIIHRVGSNRKKDKFEKQIGYN